ncbi:ABC transporter permease [Streptomyces sp. NBC_01716]|uniref:ABC transporter permease n=1 Tax=Streptomyces sp. NBC_01716 TaxID=2975917 RepID=UPI002E364EDB|nr:ABC transporter permease [Streptomyces sp. NBC_01716]
MRARTRSFAVFTAGLLARLAGSVWLLATASFLLVQLMPGDPVARLLGPTATADDRARMRVVLGLDEPLPERYLTFLHDLVTFTFGSSFGGQSVTDILSERAMPTMELALASIVVTGLLSVVLGLGMAAATEGEKRPFVSNSFTAAMGVIASVPAYVLGVGLVAAFAVMWSIFPVAGYDGVSSLVLPVLALSLPATAVLARIVRVEALGALQSDYARTVRSKQLPAHRLYLFHVLPNVVAGALTIAGVMFGYLLGGSVIVENVFQWPGLGTTLVAAVDSRDYPVLQIAIILIGISVLLVNSLVDLALYAVDPRVRTV